MKDWEKKIPWFFGRCLREFFLTPVEGRRDRWSGQPSDWVQWSDSLGPLYGHTTGLRWVVECFLLLVEESDPWWFGVRFSDNVSHIPVWDTSRSLFPCDGKRVWDTCSWWRQHVRFLWVLGVNPFCRGQCHWIRGWGLNMGSIPGSVHWWWKIWWGDVLGRLWMFFSWGGGGGEVETPEHVLLSRFHRTTRVSEHAFLCYILHIDQ
jgi:hypothetical protein